MKNEHAYNADCNCLRCVNIDRENNTDMFWKKQGALIDQQLADSEEQRTLATHKLLMQQIAALVNSSTLSDSYKQAQLSKLYKWKNIVEDKLLNFMSSPLDAA